MRRTSRIRSYAFFFTLFLISGAALTNVFATTIPSSGTSGVSHPVTLTVSAAASLKDALSTLEKTYEKKHPDVKIDFNLGASGALRKQIEEGAPADLFLSADTKNIDVLENKQLIRSGSKTVLLSNDLVLLAHKTLARKIHATRDLGMKDITYIALGTPESVPAGAYAKESLEYLKLWHPLSSKYVFGKDVKQVMSYVETNNAQAGFVYASDAKLAKNSVVVLRLPAQVHSPIRYGAAVIQSSTHGKEAQDFLNYLTSPEAQKVFRSYGFTSPK